MSLDHIWCALSLVVAWSEGSQLTTWSEKDLSTVACLGLTTRRDSTFEIQRTAAGEAGSLVTVG